VEKIGLICNLSWERCYNLKQYYHVVKSLYGSVKLINTCEDLDGVDLLFVGDDHHYAHKKVLDLPGFVDKCNANKIKVVVLTAERIFDSSFSCNIDKFKHVRKFNYLYQYMMDADDCELLGTTLHRNLFSKEFKNFIDVDANDKLDEIVFIGSADPKMYGGCYKERADEIIAFQKLMPLKVIPPTIKTWKEYMETLAKYRFVFHPIGNGNFLAFRFYEALLVKSIPIHQVRKNTLKYYDIEAKFDDCIFFEHVDELPEKIQNFTLQYSHSELWFEDYLGEILKKDGLL